jgi:hypothetical protein
LAIADAGSVRAVYAVVPSGELAETSLPTAEKIVPVFHATAL